MAKKSKEEFKPIPEGAIYVAGSNESGFHGAGTAAIAAEQYGARYGVGFGPQGQSFMIPTKDWDINTLDLSEIRSYVDRFLAFARGRPNVTFYITKIGCGLAGHSEDNIRRMFVKAPKNCILPYGWTLVKTKPLSPAAAWPFPTGNVTETWE